MPRLKRTERGQLARQRILEAAESLFAVAGFHGTSVRDIAGAAEMPTASLLHHFASKHKLYAAVLGAIADDLETHLSARLALPGDDGERLRRLCHGYLDWAAENPGRSNLLLRELLDNPGRLDEARTFPLAPLVDAIGAFIRGGQRRGSFRRMHPTIFVVGLVGSASYMQAALPTLARIRGATSQTLLSTYRAETTNMLARALLIERTA